MQISRKFARCAGGVIEMNPTELFIQRLENLLRLHQEETGVYITEIHIKRVVTLQTNQIYAEHPIQEITLEIA